jgi:hypothetical protein
VLVIGSFVMFAADQAAGASHHQQAELTGGPSSNSSSSAPTSQRGQPGRFIDDAADTLTAPFASIVESKNAWVDHGVPTLLGLIVYGVGLGYLARFSRGFA